MLGVGAIGHFGSKMANGTNPQHQTTAKTNTMSADTNPNHFHLHFHLHLHLHLPLDLSVQIRLDQTRFDLD